MADITDETLRRVNQRIAEFARLSGHTNTEVAYALLSGKTMRRHGYRKAQRGHLTEEQGKAAVAVLDHWIEVKNGQR